MRLKLMVLEIRPLCLLLLTFDFEFDIVQHVLW